MKNSVPTGAIIAIAVVAVLVIGFIAFKMFGGDASTSPNSAEAKAEFDKIHANSAINQHMQGNRTAGEAATPQAGTMNSGQGARGAYTNRSMPAPVSGSGSGSQ